MEFEQGFAETQRAAQAVERAAKDILRVAKQMEKAAQEGDIKKLRKAAAGVGTAIEIAGQVGLNARSAWPFSEDQEQLYLELKYAPEFLASAKTAGLTVHERDERLIAFPSILRILPSERAVKVDRKKVYGLRPSHLTDTLLKNQKRGPRTKSQPFLEDLYRAYKLLTRDRVGTATKLMDVYQAFTLQSGSAAEYGKAEFARDLFMLDASGISRTRSGANVSLTGAPSAKGAERDRISFVAPDGELKTYYGLQFTEDKP